MNRYEYFKKLSLEELADELCSWSEVIECSSCPGKDKCVFGGGRANGLVKWLQEEVDEK